MDERAGEAPLRNHVTVRRDAVTRWIAAPPLVSRAMYERDVLPAGGAVVAGTTTVQLAHLTEMRTALQQAYFAAGLLGPNFTDPALVPQYTLIYAQHLTEPRNAIGDLEQR